MYRISVCINSLGNVQINNFYVNQYSLRCRLVEILCCDCLYVLCRFMFPNSYILLQTFKVLMRIVENFPKLAAAEFPGIASSTLYCSSLRKPRDVKESKCQSHGYLAQCEMSTSSRFQPVHLVRLVLK